MLKAMSLGLCDDDPKNNLFGLLIFAADANGFQMQTRTGQVSPNSDSII